MHIIDKGSVPVERLFFYLEEYFGIEYLGKEKSDAAKEFHTIENNEGKWEIRFNSFPPQKILFFIIAIFKSKLDHQKLEKIILNYGKVAGSSYYPFHFDYQTLTEMLEKNEAERVNGLRELI